MWWSSFCVEIMSAPYVFLLSKFALHQPKISKISTKKSSKFLKKLSNGKIKIIRKKIKNYFLIKI